MTTRIANVFVPEVLSGQIAAEMDTRTSALIRSGAVAYDPLLESIAAQNRGNKITIPQYASYTAADQVGSDDVSGTVTTTSRKSFQIDVPLLRRVIAFGAMDLARAEANADPLGDVAVQAAEQIIANQNTVIICALEGVRADNASFDNGDMIIDLVGTTTAVASNGSNQIGRGAILSAVAQWGDYGNQAAALVMHSAVYYGILQRDRTSFLQQGEQGFVDTYMGIPIVLDDELTTVQVGTSPNQVTAYHTFVLAPGAVRFASLPRPPVLDRDERVGKGWGQATLIIRRTDMVNPRGIDHAAGEINTNKKLCTSGSWDRRWQRKNVGIAYIKSFA